MLDLNNIPNNINDLNTPDEKGNTYLIYACKANNTKLAKSLVERGAFIKHLNKKNHTAIYYALRNFNVILATYLYDHRYYDLKNEYETFFDDIQNTLCLTYKNALYKKLKFFPDLNYINDAGETIMTQAILYSRSNINIEFLIENGVDINLKNRKGQTPLDIYNWLLAINQPDLNNIKRQMEEYIINKKKADAMNLSYINYLKLRHEFDKNIKTKIQKYLKSGQNIREHPYINKIFKMSTELEDTSLFNLLLNNGIDVNYGIKSSPLMYVLLFGNSKHETKSEYINKLIDANANLNICIDSNKTPLNYILDMEDETLITKMLNKKAFVNELSIANMDYIVTRKNFKIIKRFIEMGVMNPQYKKISNGFRYDTIHNPLNAALNTGDLVNIKYILNMGVDINDGDIGIIINMFDLNVIKNFFIKRGLNLNNNNKSRWKNPALVALIASIYLKKLDIFYYVMDNMISKDFFTKRRFDLEYIMWYITLANSIEIYKYFAEKIVLSKNIINNILDNIFGHYGFIDKKRDLYTYIIENANEDHRTIIKQQIKNLKLRGGRIWNEKKILNEILYLIKHNFEEYIDLLPHNIKAEFYMQKYVIECDKPRVRKIFKTKICSDITDIILGYKEDLDNIAILEEIIESQ